MKQEKILFLLIIILFLLFSIWQIKHPISQADENAALINSASIINKNFQQIFGPSITLFGKQLPLLFCNYHGNIEHYLYLPFLVLFGIGHISFHIAAIFYSILTIIFTFYFVKDFFNKKIAIVSVFLLATNLTFILGTRYTILMVSIIPTITMGSLLCLWKWYKNKNLLSFYLGLFLLGLSLNTRGFAISFVNAVLVTSLWFRKELKQRILKEEGNILLKYFILGFLFFCTGAFPILYYNLTMHFDTLNYIFKNLPVTHEGINNLDYFKNVFMRINNLIQLLNGRCLLNHFDTIYRTKISAWTNNFYSPVLLASLLWSCFSVIFLRDRFRKKKIFLLIIIFLIFLQSPFTVAYLSPPHLFILLPFVQILIGVSFFEFFINFKKAFLKSIVVGVFFILILMDLVILGNKYFCLNKMGGRGDDSDAIYELINWLKKNNYKEPVALDSPIRLMLSLLSGNEIRAKGFIFNEHLNFEAFSHKFYDEFKARDNIYIFHTPEFTRVDYYESFRKLIQNSGKYIIEKELFYQRDGVAVYRTVAIK